MSLKVCVAVLNVPETLCAALGALCDNVFGRDVVVLNQQSDNAHILDFSSFSGPLRAGVILDKVAAVLRSEKHLQSFDIGPYSVDLEQGVWHEEGASPVRLTEKEQALLKILYEAGAQTVSRQDLLSAVWGYVEGLETHTLETHIYRLRQKIEKDPADPAIVLTGEDGYKLAVF